MHCYLIINTLYPLAVLNYSKDTQLVDFEKELECFFLA